MCLLNMCSPFATVDLHVFLPSLILLGYITLDTVCITRDWQLFVIFMHLFIYSVLECPFCVFCLDKSILNLPLKTSSHLS